MPLSTIAPGLRVLIRDAEWLVRRVDPTDAGAQALSVVGVTEIVRNREAVFISDAEERIDVLDPVDTKLVADTSNAYAASKLYLESLLRQRPPTGTDIFLGHKAAMDLMQFQLKPAARVLEQPRQRILIADSVGLGKTLEAGILLTELIRRGKAKRILVVAIKSMLTQFQKEMWSRFTIPLVRLDSLGLQRVRSRIPTHQNPFYYYDRSIISIDTLKQDNEFRHYLENAYWDVIVIDEAHNVAKRGSGRSQRSRLAELLSSRSDALIMLSATPHDGRRESFASLMNMLDPTAIADEHSYTKDDIQGLYERRFKKDIQAEAGQAFPARTISKVTGPTPPSPSEEVALQCLADLEFTTIDQRHGGGMLFRITLEKALFSSPAACIETIDNRVRNIGAGRAVGNEGDRAQLVTLRDAVAAIDAGGFSKYQNLLTLLKKTMKWKPSRKNDRLVIFTERIATLEFLYERLIEDMGLKENQVARMHGSGMTDKDLQDTVEEFGKENSPVRLLLATDMASEGINLHYLCHRMIHFDVPWSLMVFSQRNGRIDRYGQTEPPEIHYLMTETAVPGVKGDLRVLELLIDKDQEAQNSIGDPSALLDKYDQEAEEQVVAQAMSTEEKEAWLEKQMNSIDPLDLLLGTGGESDQTADAPRTRDLLSLYRSDMDYVTTALDFFQNMGEQMQYDVNTDGGEVLLTLTEELESRFHFLPREIHPGDHQFCLCADPDKICSEIERCRKEDSAWPKRHYLWPLNPVVEWLNDRMLSAFGRHEAPVIVLSSLPAGASIVLLSGLIPNRQGHPLVHEWFGVRFDGGTCAGVLPFEDVLKASAFADKRFPNRTDESMDTSMQKQLLAEAVSRGNEHIRECRATFVEQHMPVVEAKLSELETLHAKHEQLVEIRFEEAGQRAGAQRTRKERRLHQVRLAFDAYREWIENTMRIEEQAHLQVLAVFTGDS